MHARPFVDVEEAVDKVRGVDKGQPVTRGVDAENIVVVGEVFTSVTTYSDDKSDVTSFNLKGNVSLGLVWEEDHL